MSPDLRGWQPFEPGDDPLPASLSGAGESGEVVVLAAADGGRMASWSREAAASVARSWAADTERLLLMDLDLEAPGLHRVLGIENEEGATDFFLFGSSIQRVARSVDDGAFFFAPAGTATAEPGTVLRHRRWERLVQGFREARARLLLYLPLDAPGSDAVLDRADRIVLLAEREDVDDERLGGRDARVAAALGPPTTGPAGSGGGDAAREGSTVANGGTGDGEPVVDIGELAPDEDVVDIADLAPDGPVVDVGDLAPEPAAGAGAPEASARATASRETGAPDGEVVDIGELAPDEEVVDIADLAPDGPVVDIAALAPDEEVVDIADLAPDRPAASPEPGASAEGLTATGGGAEPAPAGEIDSDDEPERPVPPEETVGEAVEDAASEEAPVSAEEPSTPTGEAPDAEAVPPDRPPAGSGEGPAETTTWPEEEEGEEEFGDFDLSSLDELSEGGEPRMDEPGDSGVETEEDQDPGIGAGAGDAGVGDREPPRPEAGATSAGLEAGASGSDAAEDFGDDLVTGADFGEPGAGGAGEGDAAEAGQGEAATGASGATAPEPREVEPEPARPARPAPRDEAAEMEEPEREGGEADADAVRGRTRSRRAERTTGWGAPSRRPLRLTVLLLLVAVGAFGAHWYDVVRLPGLDRALATVLGPANTGRAPVVETTDPAPSTPVVEYSLLVDTYRDIGSAVEVASALGERLPNRVFVVAPVQTNGDVSHRILAGPAATADEARALREPLAGVLTREDPEDWTVRATPLAFLLQESGSLQSARARVGELSDGGVPAYVLQVAYPDGGVQYRVYAGAYGTSREARAMKGILSQAGITDVTFTERRGRIPE